MAKSTYYNIVTNQASREATIYIYGVIGGIDWDTWEEINTASKFTDEFKEVEQEADTIHVRINSPGGNVFEGMAIYNALFASKKKIITYNDGICASMGAIILLAGDEIHAFRNSTLMIHNASSGSWGNRKEIEEGLAILETIDRSLSTALEDRLGISEEEVAEKYMNYKDNWFDAKEAKELGFYDHIIQKDKEQAPQDVKNLNTRQLFQQYAAMTFDIPEISKPKNMSKPNSYPNLEATLGLNAPLAVNDNGSYLNEDQKLAIENALSANATTIKTAQEAQAKAEADLQAANEAHATALETAEASTTAAVAALRAAATLAGAKDLAEDASTEDIQAAITAQINVLNAKPGATHTTNASNDEQEGNEHAYLDFDNSIYSQLKK